MGEKRETRLEPTRSARCGTGPDPGLGDGGQSFDHQWEADIVDGDS